MSFARPARPPARVRDREASGGTLGVRALDEHDVKTAGQRQTKAGGTDDGRAELYNGWMSRSNPTDAELKQLLTDATTIAVVGASSNPERSSHGVMRRLKQLGYRVVPVNPREREVLGERAYAALTDVPVPIDIVDVFRRAEATPPIADAAVTVGAKALWLQSGIVNEDAAARAAAGGLMVVMDACIGTMHAVLRVPPKH